MSICCSNDNFDTYIVTSINASEEKIEKLKEQHLPIVFYDDNDGSYYDEVGGFHSAAIGWNPNGVWCGECTRISCSNCSSRNAKEENHVAGKSSSSSGSRN